ncbi:MAG: DUF456 domain-containing protein [Paludibacter sp.]|nr:DUF456 domain-containing protein [Paludibacter sp.]
MDIILIIISGFFLIVGFIGCVLPIIPGLPLSYLGIIFLHLTDRIQFSTHFLLLWGFIVVMIQLLDFVIPIWGTKKFGGSRKGVWGSTLGLIVGLFFGPWGIILGPFAGAFLGELMADKTHKNAVKAAFGSFVGILFGTIAKLIVAGFLLYYYVTAFI